MSCQPLTTTTWLGRAQHSVRRRSPGRGAFSSRPAESPQRRNDSCGTDSPHHFHRRCVQGHPWQLSHQEESDRLCLGSATPYSRCYRCTGQTVLWVVSWLIQVTFDFQVSLSDAVRLIPMQLYLAQRAARQANSGRALQLSPSSSTIRLAEIGGRAFLDTKSGRHKWTNCSIVTGIPARSGPPFSSFGLFIGLADPPSCS